MLKSLCDEILFSHLYFVSQVILNFEIQNCKHAFQNEHQKMQIWFKNNRKMFKFCPYESLFFKNSFHAWLSFKHQICLFQIK